MSNPLKLLIQKEMELHNKFMLPHKKLNYMITRVYFSFYIFYIQILIKVQKL